MCTNRFNSKVLPYGSHMAGEDVKKLIETKNGKSYPFNLLFAYCRQNKQEIHPRRGMKSLLVY